MSEIVHQPTRRDRLIFAAILLVLGMALAGLMVARPTMLFVASLVAAGLLAIAWLAKRSPDPRALVLPIVLFVLSQAAASESSQAVAGVTLTVFAITSLLTAVSAAFGERLYVQWMRAVEPVGWSFSCLLFAVVYFGMITPMGWLMRAVGYDPLQRRFDRDAPSYWVERPPTPEIDRYFRQF